MMRAFPTAQKRQRGVAIITALLLTTLAVTIVASLFWMQQVQVRSMENQRLQLQTKWILRGGIDFSRMLLREEGLQRPAYTSLLSIWNTPLEETKLDDYVEKERLESEKSDATLQGRVLDATARYNLNNLAQGTQIDLAQVALYKRLLENVQVNPTLAQKTAQAVADGSPPGPVTSGASQPAARSIVPLGLTRIEDLLAIPGYTLADVNKLREVAVVLPAGGTTINVNTAPAEVISALVSGFSVAQANALVARRKQADYRTPADFTAQLFGVPQTNYPSQTLYDVKSEWFLVRSRVRLDRAALDAESLINRQLTAPNATIIEWVRQN
ncbi:type II secretion system minor pseudopilin GspK [Massilia sp. TSP1-1-2]|uniref:type II secretion system minor pseudopilin GspK n=2 Tax=unclassified Massilia TaxID=2609279 RepID=UPI003CFA65BF